MNKYSSNAVRMIRLGLMLAISVTPVLANATAKSSLKEVQAAGTKWQSDAVLTHVSTLNGQANGQASSWLYTFYSPKVKKSAVVTAGGGKVELEEVLRNTSVDPLPADYLDSDKVLEAAAKAGLKTGAANVMLALTTFGQATGKPRVYWTVTVMADGNMSAVTLDAKNGSLIKRDDVKMK